MPLISLRMQQLNWCAVDELFSRLPRVLLWDVRVVLLLYTSNTFLAEGRASVSLYAIASFQSVYAGAERTAKGWESRVFAENSFGLGIMWSDTYINQSQPTRKQLLWEKVAQMPLISLCSS